MFRWILNFSLNKSKFFYTKIVGFSFSNAKQIKQTRTLRHANTSARKILSTANTQDIKQASMVST